MNLSETFPLMFCLNLARRQDRRARCEQLFEDFGLKVFRFPAINARFAARAGVFDQVERRGHGVSTRLILRRAMQLKAPAVLIFEDDVVLDPEVHERLAEVELPDDWGMFYLGCQHWKRPGIVAPGLVKIGAGLDTHAWGVRAPYYREVMRVLAGKRHRPVDGALVGGADLFLARAHEQIPSYATYPNLAWQAREESDILKGIYSSYGDDGLQRFALSCTRGLVAEALGGEAVDGARREAESCVPFYAPCFEDTQHLVPSPQEPVAPPPCPVLRPDEGTAFIFCDETAGETSQERLWKAWVEEAGGAEIYRQAGVPSTGIGLVQAQIQLLREALETSGNAFFVILPGSASPIRPCHELLRLLALDGRSRLATKGAGWIEAGAQSPQSPAHPKGIPASAVRRHQPWLLLNRQAARTVVANAGLLERFKEIPAPEQCFTGTILQIAGVGDEHIATDGSPLAIEGEAGGSSLAEAIALGAWFVLQRKAREVSSIG